MQNKRFDEVKLSKELQRAIAEMKFEIMTPIQSEAIPYIMEGRDVIGQAQTGTGKTLAFGIPIIEQLERKGRDIEALILCPTRELAVQITGELKKLARFRRDVHVVAVYGGQPIQKQFDSLHKGARIVVGTPGRIMDHMNRGTIRLDAVRFVVLDEADRMLDMGFVDDMKTILFALPDERQTLLFSATIQSVISVVGKFQTNPHLVDVVGEQITVPQVEQAFLEVKPWKKIDAVCHLIDTYNPVSSLIFCNTKRRVDEIVRDLQHRGYHADSLHGDMSQSRRDSAMLRFRRKQSKVLVATDVAARGLDVKDIEVVINYDLPQDEEHYVHRIGRTARMGRGGRAFSLVLSSELPRLRNIQDFAGARIKREMVPNPQSASQEITQQAV